MFVPYVPVLQWLFSPTGLFEIMLSVSCFCKGPPGQKGDLQAVASCLKFLLEAYVDFLNFL